MSRRSIMVAVALTAAAVLGLGVMTAQERPAKGPDRTADKQAIEKLTQDAVKAFNDRDAAALTASWTDEGEYIRNDGEPVRGRAEVEKAYAAYFRTLKGRSKVDVQTDNLRFTSADTAVAEVTLRLKNDDGEVIASSWRNTLVVPAESAVPADRAALEVLGASAVRAASGVLAASAVPAASVASARRGDPVARAASVESAASGVRGG